MGSAAHAFTGRAILTRVSKDREEREAELRAARKLASAVKRERKESRRQPDEERND